jgi:hypothetical protein
MDLHPKASAIFSKTQLWFSWTGDQDTRAPDRIEPEPLFMFKPGSVVNPPKLLWYYLYYSIIYGWECGPYTCGFLVRRAAANRVGGYEASFKSLGEDTAFFSKLLLHEPVFLSDKCWARYRQHPKSTCRLHEKNGNTIRNRYNSLKWFENYLIDKELKDICVFELLGEQLLTCGYKLKGIRFLYTILIIKLIYFILISLL